MTFEQIKLEIAKRVGDVDFMKTRASVGRLFEQAVAELAASDDTRTEEIPDLAVNEDDAGATHNLAFVNEWAQISLPTDMLRFIDLYLHPTFYGYQTGSPVSLKEISWDEAKRSRMEPAFKPTGNECFWYRTTTKIMFALSDEWEGDYTSGQIFVVLYYIKNPDMTEWTVDINLVSDLGYSRNFLYKCIDRVVSRFSPTPGEK